MPAASASLTTAGSSDVASATIATRGKRRRRSRQAFRVAARPRAQLDHDGVGAGRLDQREGPAQLAGRTHRLHAGRLVDHADQTAAQDGRVSEEEHAGDPAGGARHRCRHN